MVVLLKAHVHPSATDVRAYGRSGRRTGRTGRTVGWTVGWLDARTDRRTDSGRKAGRTEGQLEGRTADGRSVARTTVHGRSGGQSDGRTHGQQTCVTVRSLGRSDERTEGRSGGGTTGGRWVGRAYGRTVGPTCGLRDGGIGRSVTADSRWSDGRTVGQTDGTDGRSGGRTHGQMDGQVADVSVVLLSDDLQMSTICSDFFALRVRPCGAPTVGQRGASSKHADSLEVNKHEGKTQLSSSQKGTPLRRTTKRNLHNLSSGLCPAIRPNQEPPRGSAQFAPNSVTSTPGKRGGMSGRPRRLRWDMRRGNDF